MTTLSLKQVEDLIGSPRLRHLLEMDKLVPIEQRTGLWTNLRDINSVMWKLRQHRDAVYGWASERATAQTRQRELEAAQAEVQASEQIQELVGRFGDVGVVFENPPQVDDLRAAYRSLADEVDRHLRDEKNLGPSRSEHHRRDLTRLGGVTVEDPQDPLVDAARAIREALPEVEEAVAYARALRWNVNVDPHELDDQHCRQVRELFRQHGPTVPIPGEDHRPSLPREVGERLREWGVLGEDSAA